MNVKDFIMAFYPNYEEEKSAFVNKPNMYGEPPPGSHKAYREEMFNKSEENFMKALENFKSQICEKQREECMFAMVIDKDAFGEANRDHILNAKEPKLEDLY